MEEQIQYYKKRVSERESEVIGYKERLGVLKKEGESKNDNIVAIYNIIIFLIWLCVSNTVQYTECTEGG